MNNRLGIFSSAVLATVATASTALAHTSSEIGGGFIHPVSGIDHLLTLLANAPVGVLAGAFIALTFAGLGARHLIRSRHRG